MKPVDIDKLPFKQRLAIRNCEQLAPLGDEPLSGITVVLDDKALSANLIDVLSHCGLPGDLIDGVQPLELSKVVGSALKQRRLVLLAYRPKGARFNLINMIRGIRQRDPSLEIGNLVPVFVAHPAGDKQLQVVQLLAPLGIRLPLFCSPDAAMEKNLEELVEGLADYARIREGAFDPSLEAGESVDAPDGLPTVEEYREQLAAADALMEQGNFEQAVEELTAAIDKSPSFAPLVKRGDAYFKLKRYLHAMEDYRQAHAFQRDAADPHAKLGACCFAVAKEKARKGEGGDKVREWMERGFSCVEKGVAITNRLIEENPHMPENHPTTPYGAVLTALSEADLRGLGFTDLESRVDAISDEILYVSSRVDYLDSETDIEARISRAVLLTRKGKYEEAERIFRSIIDDDPEEVGPVFNNFAVELRRNGEYKKAFEIYLELLKFDIPDRSIVIENCRVAGFRWGQALRDDARMEEATSIYKNILSQMAKSEGKEWVLCELAVTYLEMQDQASASSRLMEAVYLNPELANLDRFKKQYKDLVSLHKEMIKKLTRGAL